MVRADYVVQPTSNWYFMIVSTFVIVAIGTFVTDKIVEPRLKAHKHTGEDVKMCIRDRNSSAQ